MSTPDTPAPLNAGERHAEDLTLAILHFYGYTDDDVAEADRVHPGRVCDEDGCYDEDGKSVHPSAYAELGATSSTVVEVILPWLAAHDAALLAERDALAERVERVKGMHTSEANGKRCRHDGMTWPCPTVAALDVSPEADDQKGSV